MRQSSNALADRITGQEIDARDARHEMERALARLDARLASRNSTMTDARGCVWRSEHVRPFFVGEIDRWHIFIDDVHVATKVTLAPVTRETCQFARAGSYSGLHETRCVWVSSPAGSLCMEHDAECRCPDCDTSFNAEGDDDDAGEDRARAAYARSHSAAVLG